jgi:hypothetical protein
LAIYHSGNLDTVERDGHLGHEAIWASVARENGPALQLEAENHIRYDSSIRRHLTRSSYQTL